MTIPQQQEAGPGLFDTPVRTAADAMAGVIDTDAELVEDVLSGPSALAPMAVHHHQAAPQGIVGEMLAYSKAADTREINRIMQDARRVGEMLGTDAYYSWRVKGQLVEGPSIQLMEALQGVWGHLAVESEIREVVDTERGERITLRVQVVDLITCNIRRNDQVFTLAPPPGKFANDLAQSERWRAMELNKAISKSVRGCLEDVIPLYVVSAAMKAAKNAETQAAYATRNGRVSHADAVKGALEWFQGRGVSQNELEWKLDAEVSMWTASDILKLRELVDAIKSSRTTVEAEWAAIRDRPEPSNTKPTTKGGLNAAKQKPAGEE